MRDMPERREYSQEEKELVNEHLNRNCPEIVEGEIWELEIGKFKVISAGNKYVKLRRLK